MQGTVTLRSGHEKRDLRVYRDGFEVSQIAWPTETEPSIAPLLDLGILRSIRDETDLDSADRRALLLSVFPAIDFGGEYIVAGGDLDSALAALGMAIAKTEIEPSRSRLVNGGTAHVYVECFCASVTFRAGEVVITKSRSEGGEMRHMRAVPHQQFPGDWECVVPASSYTRGAPVVLDNPAWLAPRLADAIASPTQTTRPGYLGSLHGVVVVGDGVLHDEHSRILADSLQNIRHDRIIPHFYRPAPLEAIRR